MSLLAARVLPQWRLQCVGVRGSIRTWRMGLKQTRSLCGEATRTAVGLQISNPALLLNNVSHRYSNLARILMEYVDNAIDDREHEFREHGRYLEPLELLVDLMYDGEATGKKGPNRIIVRDNCRGMRQEKLMRLVENIGESEKKLTPWLNGQFGFGMHAFRAAAERLVVRTRHEDSQDVTEIEIDRMETSFLPATTSPEPLAHASPKGTGTEVTLEAVDVDWGRDLTAESLAQEIEHHFERLLTRPNLEVRVRAFGQEGGDDYHTEISNEIICAPFDYGTIKGAAFEASCSLDDGSSVNLHLKVADREYEGQRARVFLLGRRINEIGNIFSFVRKSKYKQQLWSHPQLLGYIEVEGIEPVITRDEFKRNAARELLYNKLVELEEEIQKALTSELEKQREISLGVIENVLGNVLHRQLVLADRRAEQPGVPKPEGDEGERTNTEVAVDEKQAREEKKSSSDSKQNSEGNTGPKKPTQKTNLAIVMRDLPVTGDGVLRRYQTVGNLIEINTSHPDFRSRVKQKRGRLHFTDRLAAYLANVITASYRDHYYNEKGKDPNRYQVYDDLLRDAAQLEQALRRQMPRLQREIESIGKKIKND